MVIVHAVWREPRGKKANRRVRDKSNPGPISRLVLHILKAFVRVLGPLSTRPRNDLSRSSRVMRSIQSTIGNLGFDSSPVM